MKLPEHLFVSSSDGNLYDTRVPDWHKKPPLHRDYCRTFLTIKTGAQLRATLRNGGAAWPGGDTVALYTRDGEMASIPALCADKLALWSALYDIRTKQSGRIVGSALYYEGPTMQCCYTNTDIESSYGGPDGGAE